MFATSTHTHTQSTECDLLCETRLAAKASLPTRPFCDDDDCSDSRERVGNYVGSHLDTICLPSGFSVIYGLIVPTLPPHTQRLALRICRVSYLLVSPLLCAVVCGAKFSATLKKFTAPGNTQEKMGNQEGEPSRKVMHCVSRKAYGCV
jgi:hypothetical protein